MGTGPLTVNGGVIVPRLAGRTFTNSTTFAGDATIGLTSFNNQITFSGPVSLGGGARTLTITDTTLTPDATISGVISSGGLIKAGAGTMVLSGANTYSGATTITGGLLRVEGSGSISSTTGVTINGTDAKLLYTSSVALPAPVTLTEGTLDATGTIGAVAVGGEHPTILANGNGGTATLTTGNLSFAGAASVNLSVTSAGAGISAGTLTTSGADAAIRLNISKTGGWINGANNLISFTSFPSAEIADFDFDLISSPPLGARQELGGLVISGNNIALQVIGTSIYWTGLQSNQWTSNIVGVAKNWKQTSNNALTDFMDSDDVVFNDTPTTDQTIQINDADVIPTTIAFNNSTRNYTFSSTGNFGISQGILTKSGTGTVTLNTNNIYSGGTTLNAGRINVNNPGALGMAGIVINGGTLGNTSGAAVALTANNTLTLNADFSFAGANNLDLGSGAVTGAGVGNRTVTVAGNVLTVGELKSAAGQGFIKQGAGTLAVTSTGAGAASSVIDGTLTVGAGTFQFNRTGAPDVNTTGDLTVAALAGTGTITNGANYERWLFVNGAGPNTFGGTLSNGVGTGALGLNKPGASTL
ncbi:MAG: hypothetical protein EOP87_18475, partial [Verrucomicrobiaceae bacterium]